jgi:two-component system, NtrC family, sensor histidine kinase PilS
MATLAAEFQKEMESFDFAFRRKLQGLLLFRLLVAVFFLLLTILVQSRHAEDLLAGRLQPLYYFSSILFAFTIVGSHRLPKIHNLKRFAYVQVIFDVMAVTVLIYLSGGVDSIYSFLYMPVIMSAAVLLMKKGSVLIASISTLCYGIMLDMQYLDWIKPFSVVGNYTSSGDSGVYFHTILMNICAFYLIAYVSGYLAEELENSSRRIQQQQQDLRRLEMLNLNIVQSINSGLVTVDLSGSIQHLNRHAQEILGLDQNQIMGRSIEDVFPGLDAEMVMPDEAALHPRPPDAIGRREIRYVTPGGDRLQLGYAISALQDFSHQCFGWIINFQDLTAVREMETHVQRMERLAFAGKIAAEIAHEIKNPLAAMSGSMQMLQGETCDEPDLARLTAIVSREIDRINTLVTDFLWLAKSPPKAERIQPLPVCQMILDTISLMKRQQEISSLYRVQTHFEMEPVLQMDPHIFQQILWNLFTNALEAMPDGGDLVVRVSAHPNQADKEVRGHSLLRIDIEDSGCGISPELQEKIFEPFFTTKEKGTGLGLSTVYQLLQSCGGRIEVHSEHNCGSIFSLLFPLPKPDNRDEEQPYSLALSGRMSSSEPSPMAPLS